MGIFSRLFQSLSGAALYLIVGLLGAMSVSGGALGTEELKAYDRASTLMIARVSGNPRRHYNALGALGAYIAPRLADVGIASYRVRLARNNEEMIDWLRSGEVDLVMETPFSALTFERHAGAELLLRAWKDGVPSYRTIFFARKDGPISSLADLGGKVIAFEDAGSTSGFLVPLTTLRQNGLLVRPQVAEAQHYAASEVRYLFAGSEINVAAWVMRGRVDAGAFSDMDWNNPAKMPPAFKRELTIFDQSPEIIRSLVLVRKGLAEPVKQRISRLLRAMDENVEGRGALGAVYMTRRFDALEGDVARSLDDLRRLVELYWASLEAQG